jgi:nucleoid DNA-binding protein
MAAAKSKKAKKTTSKPIAKKVTKKAVAKKTTKAKSTVKKAAVKTSVPKKAVKSELVLKDTPITEKQTQAQVIADLADATSLEKKAVKNVFEALRNQIQRHLKNRGSGEITLPSLGIKVRRISKKATKARQGVNPFTGEAMTIKAKPARKSARATALKSLKDLV